MSTLFSLHWVVLPNLAVQKFIKYQFVIIIMRFELKPIPIGIYWVVKLVLSFPPFPLHLQLVLLLNCKNMLLFFMKCYYGLHDNISSGVTVSHEGLGKDGIRVQTKKDIQDLKNYN